MGCCRRRWALEAGDRSSFRIRVVLVHLLSRSFACIVGALLFHPWPASRSFSIWTSNHHPLPIFSLHSRQGSFMSGSQYLMYQHLSSQPSVPVTQVPFANHLFPVVTTLHYCKSSDYLIGLPTQDSNSRARNHPHLDCDIPSSTLFSVSHRVEFSLGSGTHFHFVRKLLAPVWSRFLSEQQSGSAAAPRTYSTCIAFLRAYDTFLERFSRLQSIVGKLPIPRTTYPQKLQTPFNSVFFLPSLDCRLCAILFPNTTPNLKTTLIVPGPPSFCHNTTRTADTRQTDNR